MSAIYLIRHGQAGTRDDYDALSSLGARQARLLGDYLVEQGVRFDAVYTGELIRQRNTAEEVRQVYASSDRAFPEPVADPRWNEFDLDACHRILAPRLCADDPAFRAEYEAMRAEARSLDAAVHRKWTRCDIAIVRAWIQNRYPFEGESWQGFQDRVRRCEGTLAGHRDEENVAVFTSATPAAVWVGRSLEVNGRHTLRLAAALYNTAVTVLHHRDGEFSLFSFNSVAHLPDRADRTFR